jgi:hypothetical protein
MDLVCSTSLKLLIDLGGRITDTRFQALDQFGTAWIAVFVASESSELLFYFAFMNS